MVKRLKIALIAVACVCVVLLGSLFPTEYFLNHKGFGRTFTPESTSKTKRDSLAPLSNFQNNKRAFIKKTGIMAFSLAVYHLLTKENLDTWGVRERLRSTLQSWNAISQEQVWIDFKGIEKKDGVAIIPLRVGKLSFLVIFRRPENASLYPLAGVIFSGELGEGIRFEIFNERVRVVKELIMEKSDDEIEFYDTSFKKMEPLFRELEWRMASIVEKYDINSKIHSMNLENLSILGREGKYEKVYLLETSIEGSPWLAFLVMYRQRLFGSVLIKVAVSQERIGEHAEVVEEASEVEANQRLIDLFSGRDRIDFIELPAEGYQRIIDILLEKIETYPVDRIDVLSPNQSPELMVPLAEEEEALLRITFGQLLIEDPFLNHLFLMREILSSGLSLASGIYWLGRPGVTHLSGMYHRWSSAIWIADRLRVNPKKQRVYQKDLAAHEGMHALFGQLLKVEEAAERLRRFKAMRTSQETIDEELRLVPENAEEVLRKVRTVREHFLRHHPGLIQWLQSTLGELSEDIANQRAIDEAMACTFESLVMGRFSDRFLQIGSSSDHLKSADVELLSELRYTPDYARPSRLGYTEELITSRYYELFKQEAKKHIFDEDKEEILSNVLARLPVTAKANIAKIFIIEGRNDFIYQHNNVVEIDISVFQQSDNAQGFILNYLLRQEKGKVRQPGSAIIEIQKREELLLQQSI